MQDTAIHRFPSPSLVFALTCLTSLLVLLVGLVLSHTPKEVFAESGPIERLSALYLILSAGLLAMMSERGRWHQVVLVAAAGLRELDWDKAFTDSGVLSLRLYSGDAPLIQKAAGLVVLSVLIVAGIRLLRRDLGPWLRDLRAGRLAAWLIALILMMHAVAKSLDGLGRKLAPWGVDLAEWTNRLAGRSEEALELVAAILILQIVVLIRYHDGRQDGRA